MIRNLIQIGSRIFKRNTFSSLTNIFSIAIGMTAFILVMLWIKYELSFDKFNEKRDDIYRVTCNGKIFEKEIKDATSGGVLSKVLPNTFPEVKSAVAINDFGTAMMSKPNGEGFRLKAFGATSSFFDIFSIPIIQGDYKALEQPNTAFITQTAAKKVYGNENPIGKTLTTGMDRENKQFTIVGVIADVPKNSHFTFDFLYSLPSISFYRNATNDWLNSMVYTYVLLNKGTNYKTFENKLNQHLQTQIEPILKSWRNLSLTEWRSKGESWNFVLQPLTRIHLNSSLKNEAGQNGNIMYIYMALIIGLFILIISIVNFVNLSTVQFTSRAKEIMVKKVTGASRKSIMAQFLTESTIYSVFSLFISIAFVRLVIPLFEKFTGIPLTSEQTMTPFIYAGLFIFSVLIGVLAGLYPAFVVSKMAPLTTLTSAHLGKTNGKIPLKDALLLVQFTISIMVIICTITVSRQLDFLQNKKLGFNKENIVVVRAMEDMSRSQQNTFKEMLLKNSNIKTASYSHKIPGMNLPSRTCGLVEGNDVKLLALEVLPVEASFFDTYKIELAEGNFFTDENSKTNKKILLNEEAVKINNIKNPVGQKLYYSDTEYYEISGVVKNFHYNSKKKGIGALAFVQEPDFEMFWSPEQLSLGIAGTNYREIIGFIKSEHQKLIPGKEFAYSFFDEDYDALYKNEYQTRQLFSIFSVIAICLSCLGLFVLVKYIVTTKIKEIGIRKVSGARTTDILILLSGKYLKWVAIAFVIATPIAWYAMNKWLENFAYKTELSWWIFALAGLLALGIALLTVSWQSWRAATRNPVEALRYE
jgi:putative ABC transport system permease protein